MATRQLRVVIAGDSTGLDGAIGSAQSGLSGFTAGMQRFSAKARNVGRSLTRNLTLPIIGLGVVAYRELAEVERVMGQTAAGIESTGGAANRSIDDVVALSESLSELSSVDSEDIQESMNVLLTFGNVSGEVFDEASLQILNMSTRMGTDLPAAALQVGKALQNPIKGMTALTRVGIDFNGEYENTGQSLADTIQQLIYFGDTAGAQQIILEELNREFGGSAENFGKGPAADFRRLKNRMEDLGASILTDLLPVLRDMAEIFSDIADVYGRMTPKQQKFVAGLLLVGVFAGPASAAVGVLTGVFSALAVATGLSVGWIALLALALVGLGLGIWWLTQNWDEAKASAVGMFDTVIGYIPGVTGSAKIFAEGVRMIWREFQRLKGMAGNVFGTLKQIGTIGMGTLLGGLSSVMSMLKQVVEWVNTLISAINNIPAIPNVPSIPGVPDLPFLADGGRVRESGMAVVGEKGPEIVSLGRGAQVSPLGSSRSGREARKSRVQSRRPAPVFVVGGVR